MCDNEPVSELLLSQEWGTLHERQHDVCLSDLRFSSAIGHCCHALV